MSAGVEHNSYHRLFEVQPGFRSQQTPALVEAVEVSGPAVRHRVVTYGQLLEDVNRLAAGLAARGVGPGDRVLLLVPMSVELYESVLAVMKLGAVCLFIDPGDGLGNLDRIAAAMSPKAFVGVPRAHLLRLASRALRSIPLQIAARPMRWPRALAWTELLEPARELPTAAVRGDDPAMISFTSGSSGTPKGVCRTHGDLRAMFAMLSNHEAKRLQGVDFCAFPAFPLDDLSAGRTSVLPCFPPGRPSPDHAAALATQLREFPPVLVTTPPWVLRLLADHCRSTGERFPSVRHVFTGGGVVPLALVRELASVFATAEFHALYGSTEAEPVSLIEAGELLADTAALTEDGAGICVGWPAPGVEVTIVEPSEEPADALHPVEGIGEIAVSGAHVNREYYRDEALTRRHKIRDAATGRCWHRMGDLGYRDAKGRLWLVGRYSSRVVTAGRTLYPDQVEPIFDVYTGIAKTVLIGVDAGPPGRQARVAALLVQFRPDAADRAGKLEAVRRGCRERGLPIAAVLECERLLHDRRIGAKVQYAALARRHGGAVRAALGETWPRRLLRWLRGPVT